MKKEITIYKVLIMLLVVANVYLLLKESNYFSTERAVVNNEVQPKSYDSILFNEIYDAAIESNGRQINTHIELTNTDEKNISLENLVKSSSILVFDFKYISCKTCFEDEIERIVNLSDDFGKDNIILVSEFENIREQYVIEKKYGLRVFNIGSNEFGLPIEAGHYPFVFVIDSNFVAKDFYIPTQQFFSMGNIFYKIVFEKYFRK